MKEASIEAYKKKAIGEASDEFLSDLIKQFKQNFNNIKMQNEKESHVKII